MCEKKSLCNPKNSFWTQIKEMMTFLPYKRPHHHLHSTLVQMSYQALLHVAYFCSDARTTVKILMLYGIVERLRIDQPRQLEKEHSAWKIHFIFLKVCVSFVSFHKLCSVTIFITFSVKAKPSSTHTSHMCAPCNCLHYSGR